jgi:lambda repressor-like predicted transcriptional regulator
MLPKMTQTKRTYRKINWHAANTLAVLALADRGFSWKCISRKTRIDYFTVVSILKRRGKKVTDYREGRNKVAYRILSKF